MRVLVVEDYAPVRKAVAQGLSEASFAVDAAADGREGLWYARNNSYDVIILDLMLPLLDGLSLLRQIRSGGTDSGILILSARDAVEQRVAGLNAGADDYLIKPFALEELLARVHVLLRRRYDRPRPEIVVGDLEINTATKSVRRGGEAVELTSREYSLLAYLALRANQTVSRTEIWENLYEFESNAHSNVVDVYIGYLRRKIEFPGRPRLLHTRRGFGYLLGAGETAR